MRITLLISALAVFLSFSGQIFAGEAAPVKTMADIMLKLNHYPSDGEKATLREIVHSKDASDTQKALATAMINLQHKVSSQDVPKLKSVMQDNNASAGEKALANIIIGLNHSPSDTDKRALQKLIE